MKCLIIFLYVISCTTCYSQKIEEIKFDKFDSIYTISTKEETLVGKFSARKYLYVIATFNWLKESKFNNLPDAKIFNVLIGFKTDLPTSTDNTTEIKFEFSDGTFGTYNRPKAKYQNVTDIGVFIFKVPINDKLFTTDIKTVRIAAIDTKIDYEIPVKKGSVLKNLLALVKSESEKLR